MHPYHLLPAVTGIDDWSFSNMTDHRPTEMSMDTRLSLKRVEDDNDQPNVQSSDLPSNRSSNPVSQRQQPKLHSWLSQNETQQQLFQQQQHLRSTLQQSNQQPTLQQQSKQQSTLPQQQHLTEQHSRQQQLTEQHYQ